MLPSGQALPECLEERGVSRRAFLNFCGVMAATLALPASYRTQIAEALAGVDRPVLIWRQFQDCAGNSESILRSPHPDVAEIVLETLAWNYHELIMAGSGAQAEAMSTQAVRDLKGKYIAVIEGAIPHDGGYCTIGGRSALDIAREVVGNAKATLAVGACAWDGGLVQHGPTGGEGVQDMVPGANVVNLGGCPHNPANTVAVLVHYLTFGQMPEGSRRSLRVGTHARRGSGRSGSAASARRCTRSLRCGRSRTRSGRRRRRMRSWCEI